MTEQYKAQPVQWLLVSTATSAVLHLLDWVCTGWAWPVCGMLKLLQGKESQFLNDFSQEKKSLLFYKNPKYKNS
jgi:hypothetical protein